MITHDPIARLLALERFGIKLGLDNIRALTRALGHPQDAWRSVHVAGTNGKGSVTAMIERGLRAAGYRTGRYTSPHLASIEERVAIDGEPVSRDVFENVSEEILDLAERLQHEGTLAASPTFFEVTTAIAFEIFRRSGVDAGVIEVGLGGRFDATNVLSPAVTAITSIALDHERHLGSSIASIAFEKAGIIKPGIPIVLGDVPEQARDVIQRVAAERGAPIEQAGRSNVTHAVMTRGRATIDVATPQGRYRDLHLGLNGAHQISNSVVAIRILELCGGAGMPVSAAHIADALTEVVWPARLEWLVLPGGSHVLVDAAHNPDGASALAAYLRDALKKPVPIVLAVMKDKDVDAIIRQLVPVAACFIATAVNSERSRSASDLAVRLSVIAPHIYVTAAVSADEAIDLALDRSSEAVVAGSIFLAGPVRARLIARGATPRRDPP